MQWPIPPFPTKAVYGGVSANVSAANTKGSWSTILTAPTNAAGSWLSLGIVHGSGSGDIAALVDLAVGSPGSETIIASNLVLGSKAAGNATFPIHVPAGAPLRARFQSPLSFMSMSLYGHLFVSEPDSGVSAPGRITGYGAVTASSGGTDLAGAGSSGVKGSYVQLTASTTAPIHALMVLAQASSTAPPTDLTYIIDVAVGGAGSETIVLPDHVVRVTTGRIAHAVTSPFLPMSVCIPAGRRLAARCSASSSSVVPVEVGVYGFTY